MPKPSVKQLHTLNERNFVRLGAYLAKHVRRKLVQHEAMMAINEPLDIKGTHRADELAYLVITEALSGVRVRGVVEGMPIIHPHIDAPILYIDPVDGSRNWDRQVGDPAFAMALSLKPSGHTLDDLQWSFVEGLHSADRYYTLKNRAHFRLHAKRKIYPLTKAVGQLRLEEMVAYIKPGYSAADKVLRIGGDLMQAVKDIRAFDNSAMELCHLARGACDLILEARDLSDFYNLLAWPILRASGAELYALDGQLLRERLFEPGQIMNFIALRQPGSKEEVLAKLIL